MSEDVDQERKLDTFTYFSRYREIVSHLSASSAISIARPLNGADLGAITSALELAPCAWLPRDVITMFCSARLGHRLIPVARQDNLGLMRWPMIDTQLTDDDLRDVVDSERRREIAHVLRILAASVEQPLGRCEPAGWIGGQIVRGDRGQARMLWPVLYPAFSPNAHDEHFDLFRDFNIAVEAQA